MDLASEREQILRGAAPIVDRGVLACLSAMPLQRWFVDETPRCLAHGVQEDFIRSATDWITASRLNCIRGIERFLYRKMTAGVTHSIEDFLWRHRRRQLRVLPGEYPYAKRLCGDDARCFAVEPGDLNAGDALILSMPFAATGGIHPQTKDYLDVAESLGVPVMLDCAYFGGCEGLVLEVRHAVVESVCFSLSKAFASGAFRVGVEFSKTGEGSAALQNRWHYGPDLAARVGLHLMWHFDADYLVRTYKSAQEAVCLRHGLVPSSTVFFGLADRGWDDFSRDGVTQRCGISALIREEWDRADANVHGSPK